MIVFRYVNSEGMAVEISHGNAGTLFIKIDSGDDSGYYQSVLIPAHEVDYLKKYLDEGAD